MHFAICIAISTKDTKIKPIPMHFKTTTFSAYVKDEDFFITMVAVTSLNDPGLLLSPAK